MHFHFVQARYCGTALQSQGLKHGQACSWKLCYMSIPWCQFYFKCRCQLLTCSVTTAAPLAFLSDLRWAVEIVNETIPTAETARLLSKLLPQHAHSFPMVHHLLIDKEQPQRKDGSLWVLSCLFLLCHHCPHSHWLRQGCNLSKKGQGSSLVGSVSRTSAFSFFRSKTGFDGQYSP